MFTYLYVVKEFAEYNLSFVFNKKDSIRYNFDNNSLLFGIGYDNIT